MGLLRLVSTFWSVAVLYKLTPQVNINSFYRICDKLGTKWCIILDIYLKALSSVDFRKQFYGIFHITWTCVPAGCSDSRWRSKTMKGFIQNQVKPNISLKICITLYQYRSQFRFLQLYLSLHLNDTPDSTQDYVSWTWTGKEQHKRTLNRLYRPRKEWNCTYRKNCCRVHRHLCKHVQY